ncbi:hypothetical protein EYF80_049869 [Liparis tanakae]|uniref:Uncharacterized protein n=1 Tax=Liparis tanakae TaxID=230148 RepID=A0A4Z2FI45_9TELE|nr:hypothetical protein EYF80_049869 [Liparis tanakae]
MSTVTCPPRSRVHRHVSTSCPHRVHIVSPSPDPVPPRTARPISGSERAEGSAAVENPVAASSCSEPCRSVSDEHFQMFGVASESPFCGVAAVMYGTLNMLTRPVV